MEIDVRFRNPELKTSDEDYSRMVRALCEVAIMANRLYIARHGAPGLYESGIVYQNEPIGIPDKLVDIPVLLERKWGDCLHLVAYHCAWLREIKGERARPRVTWKHFYHVVNGRQKKLRLFHVTVRRGDGSVECPSRKLGM